METPSESLMPMPQTTANPTTKDIKSGLTVRTTAWLIAAAMGLAVTVLSAVGWHLRKEIEATVVRWEIYDQELGIQNSSISEIKGLLGVGSLSDLYHLYQLTGDDQARKQLENSLRLLQANLDTFSASGGGTPENREKIREVEQCIEDIRATLPKIAEAHQQKLLPDQVMELSQVDLGKAHAAVKQLDETMAEANFQLSQANLVGLKDLENAIFFGAVGVGFLTLLAFVVVFVALRRIAHPLARLMVDARQLGQLELETEFHWSRRDELGELGRVLEQTRQQLRKSFQQVEQKNQRLKYQRNHDTLTSLPNRRSLYQWIEEKQRAAKASADHSLAILFLNLDDFKIVNESLSHSVGDGLIKAVASRLSTEFRDIGYLVRIGADEFVIAFDHCGPEQARIHAEKILKLFEQPFQVAENSLLVSTCIGIAMSEGQTRDAETLFRDADIALYKAKEQGRARIQMFDPPLRESILTRHRLGVDVQSAIARDEIFVVYQPIMCLQTKRPTGFEALIRWRHSELGMISPVQFIPIAEENGAILHLGRFVLDQVAHDLPTIQASWNGIGNLTVNVNFSPRQLWDSQYIEEIVQLMQHPEYRAIKIEVTESLAMADPDAARELLKRFSGLGVKLCIDDFGTGYSSLSYLARFPFDILKMDKSFINGLVGGDGDQSRLVRGVVHLAHDLGLQVVAEGIESDVEARSLTEFGCDFGQGYLYAKPLILADVLTFLAAQPSAQDAA